MLYIIICTIAVLLILLISGIAVFSYALKRNDKKCRYFYDRDYAKTLIEDEFLDMIVNGSEWIRDKEAEDVYIDSFDNLKLHARLIRPPSPKGSIILCHGYRSAGVNDFAGYAEYAYNCGYRLLIIDQRASGKSEGRYIGMGVLERHDCNKWAWYMSNRFQNEPLFLEGVSMGASTVLMASGTDLPKNVRGIIADCGFTSPREEFAYIMKRDTHLPPYPYMHLIGFIIKLIAKFDYSYSAEDALRENKLPLLILHGQADKFVPHYMSEKNVSAAKDCDVKFISVPNATHGKSYLVDMKRCQASMTDFLNKYTNV